MIRYFNNFFIFNLFFLILSCTSCKLSEIGNRIGEKLGLAKYGHIETYDKGPYTFRVKMNSTPDLLQLEDTNCSKERALKKLGVQNIKIQTNDLSYIEEQIDLENVTGDFQTEGLDGIYIKRHIRKSYSDCTVLQENYAKCNKLDRNVISSGEKVHICKSSGYSEKSAENAALNIATAIYNLRKTFGPIFGKNFSPVRILITPEIETVVTYKNKSDRFRDLDNAMWTTAPLSEAPYNLVFLPHTKNNTPKITFTSIPVALHEGGHHIYYESAKKIFHESNFNQMFDDKNYDIVSFLDNTPRRKVDPSLILAGVINEGIADFMASIILIKLGLKEKNVRLSLRANNKERDVDEETDSFNNLKQLSNKVLKEFMSHKTRSTHGYYNRSHQDIHTIGTFIAAIIEKLYKEKLGIEKASPQDADQLAIMLGEWIKNINNVNLSQKPIEVLSDSIFQGIKVSFKNYKTGSSNPSDLGTESNPGRLNKKQCQIIDERLPRFSIDWVNDIDC